MGGGMVILDKINYLHEANRLLSDAKYYKKLGTDPSTKFSIVYHDLINVAFLTINAPIMPIFYYLPKVPKCIHNPPGRPIITRIGSLSSNLSQYVDRHLQKYIQNLDYYLKDTTSLLHDICDHE